MAHVMYGVYFVELRLTSSSPRTALTCMHFSLNVVIQLRRPVLMEIQELLVDWDA